MSKHRTAARRRPYRPANRQLADLVEDLVNAPRQVQRLATRLVLALNAGLVDVDECGPLIVQDRLDELDALLEARLRGRDLLPDVLNPANGPRHDVQDEAPACLSASS